jgi:hypothetical protein
MFHVFLCVAYPDIYPTQPSSAYNLLFVQLGAAERERGEWGEEKKEWEMVNEAWVLAKTKWEEEKGHHNICHKPLKATSTNISDPLTKSFIVMNTTIISIISSTITITIAITNTIIITITITNSNRCLPNCEWGVKRGNGSVGEGKGGVARGEGGVCEHTHRHERGVCKHTYR